MAGNDGKGGNHQIGYGKPPKATQWKKGQSGNPTGKRKKPESLQSKLAKLAGEEIPLSYNGSATVMTRDLAMLHAVLQKAMKGDQASVRYVTDMLDPAESRPVTRANFKITPADINVLRTRADWVAIIEEAEAFVKHEDEPEPIDEEDDDGTSHL